MKKLIIVLIVIVVAGGLYYWYSTLSGPVRVEQADPLEGSGFGEGGSLADVDITLENASVGQLLDVSGGSGSGTAWTVREDGQLYHVVQAQLPAPESGAVYEGWLVKKLPRLQFFSTGVMTEISPGTYALTFSAGEEYDGFDDVVITLETEVDDTPEEHILEGTVGTVK